MGRIEEAREGEMGDVVWSTAWKETIPNQGSRAHSFFARVDLLTIIDEIFWKYSEIQ